MSDAPFAGLLRRGLIDTLFQVAATVGNRLLLVLAIFMLSRFVGPAQIATYDLFIVSTSLLLIFMTFGLDSALATAAADAEAESRHAAVWLSLCTSLVLFLILYWPLRFATSALDLAALFPAAVFDAAYLYAGGTAVMTLVFSYFRWVGKSLTASIAITFSNLIGFGVAGLNFARLGTVSGFIDGLLVGSAIGALVSLFILVHHAPLLPLLQMRGALAPLLGRLVRLAWPFGIASFLLMARRAVDRGILLAAGAAQLLGAYALVSRSGETAAFFLALPAMGIAPIIFSRHQQPAGARLARLLYGGYLTFAAIIIVAVIACSIFYGTTLFPDNAQPAARALVALVVGSLIFTETTVAGFGFVIAGRTHAVAWLSLLFIAVNVVVALPLVFLGYGIEAVAAGFVVGALAHSCWFVYLSERHFSFGYPLALITVGKVVAVIAAIWMLFA